jgi:hypothetical protein
MDKSPPGGSGVEAKSVLSVVYVWFVRAEEMKLFCGKVSRPSRWGS